MHRHRARPAGPRRRAVPLRPPPLPRRRHRADARAAPRRDRGAGALRRRPAARHPRRALPPAGWPARWTTATGPSSQRMSRRRWTRPCASDDAAAALELDLSSLRFLDVAGAVGAGARGRGVPRGAPARADRGAAGRAAGPRPLRRAVRRAARRHPRTPGVSHGLRCPGASDADTSRPGGPRTTREARIPVRVETTRTAGPCGCATPSGSRASADDVVAHAAPFVAAARGRDEPVALAVRPGDRAGAGTRAARDRRAARRATAQRCRATVSLAPPRRTRPLRADAGRPLGPRAADADPRPRRRHRVVEHDAGPRRARRRVLDRARRGAQRRAGRRRRDRAVPLPAAAAAPGGRRRRPAQPPLLVPRRAAPCGTTPSTGGPRGPHRPRRRARTGRARSAGPGAWASTPGSSSRCATRSRGRRRRPGATATGSPTWCWRSTRSPRTPSSTASGDAHLALWTGPGTRELLCEVHDGGRLVDPLPGPARPAPVRPPRPGAVDRPPAVRPAARVGRRRGHARPHPGPAVSRSAHRR